MSAPAAQSESFPELHDYRLEVRAWLQANRPVDWRRRMETASDEEYLAFEEEWLRELHEGSLAVPHWPEEFGGNSASLQERVVIIEEMVAADVPLLHSHRVAMNHAAETLLAHGTREQCEYFLPRILEGDIWCQGFSEPGAGSDLAAVSTLAVRDGAEYVVNGQKVWSSYAEFARWCLLLVRTDRDAPKHKGISLLICDLEAPGVEVRPIRQITGEREFCEIFLSDARIPADRLIGEQDAGWGVAQTTLTTERGVGVVGLQQQLRTAFDQLLETARRRPSPSASPAIADPRIRDRIVQLHTDIEILAHLCRRTLLGLARENRVGPESSVIKLFYSELLQRLTALGVELEGLEGQIDRPIPRGSSWTSGVWITDHLKSWGWTIGGGTSEIQRNMIGERVLGLPREPRPEGRR